MTVKSFFRRRHLPSQSTEVQKLDAGGKTFLILPRFNPSNIASNGIFLLLVLYGIFVMRDFFMPLTLAVILNFLLSPIVRLIQRKFRIPKIVTAAIIILSLLGGLAYATYALTGPFVRWLGDLPAIINDVQMQIREITKPVESMTKAAESVRGLTTPDALSENSVRVNFQEKSLTNILFSGTQSFFTYTIVLAGILFFLLSYGHVLYLGVLRILPSDEDRKATIAIATEVEHQIFKYLFTVTLINIGLGVVTTLVLRLLGMPNALLWGVMTTILNYVPYLGAILGQIIIFLVAIATFNSIPQALWIGFVYFMLTSVIEGNFVTPWVLGKRFVFNPVVLVVWLFFWGWMWSIMGTILAVPMLVIMKSVCERIKSLSPVANIIEAS